LVGVGEGTLGDGRVLGRKGRRRECREEGSEENLSQPSRTSRGERSG
jgi:hypothetical protein